MYQLTDEQGRIKEFKESFQLYEYLYTEGIISNAYSLTYDQIENGLIHKGYQLETLPPVKRKW